MDQNSVNLVGRLADDVKYTPGKGGTAARANGRLIVNRTPGKDGKNRYDTIPIVAWGVHADNLAKYTSKGKEMAISGELRVNSVQNTDGSWKNFTEVMIKEMSFGRDSSAARAEKIPEAPPEAPEAEVASASQEALIELFRSNPELMKKLNSMKQSAEPEVVPDNFDLEVVEDTSEVAEDPFC